jgi:hypothetical protein
METRYRIPKDLLNSQEIDEYRCEVDQPFGSPYNGVVVYNALVLAIFNSEALPVIEFVAEEGSPVFKQTEIILDGSIFWQSYLDGFKIGWSEFKERPEVPYGLGSEDFKKDLHFLYKHGDTHNLSWQREAKSHSLFISNSIFRRYGIFAGLCYGVDTLVKKYPAIREAIYECPDHPEPTKIFQGSNFLKKAQELGHEEVTRVTNEILKPLKYLNPQGRKIMSDDDYDRLVEYTMYLIVNDAIPADIKSITQTNISTGHIRYTYYRLHREIWGTKSLNVLVLDFLHLVFKQFENQGKETTRKKFADAPSSYDIDFNICL